MLRKIFIIASTVLIIDAVVSLVIFNGQPFLYQFGRGIRLAIGLAMLFLFAGVDKKANSR